MEEFNHSQDDVAQIVGKSRSHVANMVRLLKLSEPVKALVQSGQLSAGHARQLVGQPNALEIAQDIIKRGLNVRQVEAEMRKDGAAQARDVRNEAKGHTSGAKDADTKALEKNYPTRLGLEVTVDHRGQGGTLHIKYRDLDQLDAVIEDTTKTSIVRKLRKAAIVHAKTSLTISCVGRKGVQYDGVCAVFKDANLRQSGSPTSPLVPAGSSSKIHRTTNYHFEVRMTLQNVGNSRLLYKVVTNTYTDVLPFPLPQDFQIPPFFETGSNDNVGPHQNFIITGVAGRIYSDDDINEIQFGSKKRLYVYGRVHYEDVI